MHSILFLLLSQRSVKTECVKTRNLSDTVIIRHDSLEKRIDGAAVNPTLQLQRVYYSDSELQRTLSPDHGDADDNPY